MTDPRRDEPWPTDDGALIALQEGLAREAAHVREREPWVPGEAPLVGGCFVAFARGEAGPGHPGDRAWAAAAVWQSSPVDEGASDARSADAALRGVPLGEAPRRAADVVDQSVVAGRVPASYAAGLLAQREGQVLAAAVSRLSSVPDVLLVDATGLDHPRRAGLAVHLGAVLGVPTIGVTHRGLVVGERPPDLSRRGRSAPVELDGETVAAWVCTRSGARPLLVHAGWRTDVTTGVDVVLRASTEAARTPVPLQEARRVAREARQLDGGG